MRTALRSWPLRYAGATLLPTAWVALARQASGYPLAWDELWAAWLPGALLLLIHPAVCRAEHRWRPGGGLALYGLAALLAAGLYAWQPSTLAAGGLALALCLLAVTLDDIFSASTGRVPRGVIRLVMALLLAAILVAVGQLEARFADEEFFAALQIPLLAIYWGLLRALAGRLAPAPAPAFSHRVRLALALALLAGMAMFAGWVVRRYQGSFYPFEAPDYPGLTAATPFLCGESAPDAQVYDAPAVFQQLLALIAANPNKEAPEYALLALGSAAPADLQAFRAQILAEARQGKFTGPANSIKYGQYEASRRVYFYARIREQYPDLFSAQESAELRTWFAAINRRALTVEWVDWLYALSFSRWPNGPYENQESGAGLLALLETEGLADPERSAQNRAYLEANQRGWSARFRVTDDAAVYQPEWIYNAYFQARYRGESWPQAMQNAFDWLRLLSFPDGTPLRYNHVGSASLAGVGLLGAALTGDEQALWSAGRAVEALRAAGGTLKATPGMEMAPTLAFAGRSPVEGACLVYGDSGLPNQVGPLAPDKIVFRSGWDEDALYLLLNLRFTGWHRYKATNTISLIYQDGYLAAEKLSGETFGWLPSGRSLFRDKRVPRENLNGLVIERSGLSKILYWLTGIGGPWAQDPPYYTSVTSFQAGGAQDISRTRLSGWRGWEHERAIHFDRSGVVVVEDHAWGPPAGRAAMMWHFPAGRFDPTGRITLERRGIPATIVLLPGEGEIQFSPESSGLQAAIQGRGQLHQAVVFLSGPWANAQVQLTDGQLLITRGLDTLNIPWENGEHP